MKRKTKKHLVLYLQKNKIEPGRGKRKGGGVVVELVSKSGGPIVNVT